MKTWNDKANNPALIPLMTYVGDDSDAEQSHPNCAVPPIPDRITLLHVLGYGAGRFDQHHPAP